MPKLRALKKFSLDVEEAPDISPIAECEQIETLRLRAQIAHDIDLRPVLKLPMLFELEFSPSFADVDLGLNLEKVCIEQPSDGQYAKSYEYQVQEGETTRKILIHFTDY